MLMKNGIFFFLLLGWEGWVYGHPTPTEFKLKKRLFSDQTLSFHCKDVAYQRERKVEYKERILALLSQNRSLWKKALISSRESIRLRLKVNYASLRRHLRLALIQVKIQEDLLVRHGCPKVDI